MKPSIARLSRFIRNTIARCIVLVLISLPAFAQQSRCGDAKKVAAQLAKDYGETPQFVGLGKDGLYQLFANTETGTWTLTLSPEPSVVCLVGAGEAATFSTAAPADIDPNP